VLSEYLLGDGSSVRDTRDRLGEAVLSGADLPYLEQWEPIGGLELGRRYAHAPIVEAIVEISVETPDDLVLSALSGIEFGDAYPESQAIFRGTAEIKIEPGKEPALDQVAHDNTGFAYQRADGQRLLQVSPSVFTFIQRGTYTCWEDFIGEAEELWMNFREVARPSQVVQLGVRFVNIISLPMKPVEIRDYLRISIDVPAALPQAVRNLFTQIDIPMNKYDAYATITTAVVEPDQDRPGGGLVLDIDVKSARTISTVSSDFSGELAGTLDRLRLVKNLVFEASITDATRERIDR